MSLNCQTPFSPDSASSLIVGLSEHWPQPDHVEMHVHVRHQLMYSTRGVMHVVTPAGRWILPPTRAIWICGGTAHGFEARRPVDVITLYVDPAAEQAPDWQGCMVVNVSPLVRELIIASGALPEDYPLQSKSGRLAQVLLEQLEALPQAPLSLPDPIDTRARTISERLKANPAENTPLAALAADAGASIKTIERLFLNETGMTFGAWRLRLRMTSGLELLGLGESVGNVAHAVGYGSPSSFIAAFRTTFGTTPARYFALAPDAA